MGKSKTSPLSKTVSVIGGTGLNAGFATANPNGKAVTELDVDGAKQQEVATVTESTAKNESTFKDTDSADFHELKDPKGYFEKQTISDDGKKATMAYLEDKPEPYSKYSKSQNMNHALATGQTLTKEQQFMFDNLENSMHNVGENLKLQRYDHSDGVNKLLESSGIVGWGYQSLTQSELKQALVGMEYTSPNLLSTSYNDFKKAPKDNPFTNRAVKFEYNVKAKAKAFMPGTGPGGDWGEMILSSKNHFKITDVKFDGRKARKKGSLQLGTAKGITVYVDVE